VVVERALCLACGEEKSSAWIPCPECGNEPASLEERARHFWVAERREDEALWARLQQAIQAGEELPIDEAAVEGLLADLEEESLLGAAVFGLFIGLLPILAFTGLLLALAWALGRFAA
jgi:hypothetical protein